MARLPRVRILSTGSEILQGLYADTNAMQLSRLLFEAGFRVVGHSAAPDDRELIRRALREAIADADLVVMTGGLGPTEDDVNRFVVAELYDVELALDSEAERMMHDRFNQRRIPMPDQNVVQAMLPEGCTPIYNFNGTAPGFFLPGDDDRAALVALPGVPHEWPPMFRQALETKLATLFHQGIRPARGIHTIHTASLPESQINQAVADLFAADPMMEMTILATPGHIRLRLIAEGTKMRDAEKRIQIMRARVLERLGPEIVFAEGAGDLTLESTAFDLLRQKKATLALAESCTGGLVAKLLTDIPGSSAMLLAGYVTYSNDAKMRDLGVTADLLKEHGAVSEAAARAMAEGARRRAGADYALSITGIAGPGGGTREKPAGTVWFAIASPEGTAARLRQFNGDRTMVRELAARQALDYLRRQVRSLALDAELPSVSNSTQGG